MGFVAVSEKSRRLTKPTQGRPEISGRGFAPAGLRGEGAFSGHCDGTGRAPKVELCDVWVSLVGAKAPAPRQKRATTRKPAEKPPVAGGFFGRLNPMDAERALGRGEPVCDEPPRMAGGAFYGRGEVKGTLSKAAAVAGDVMGACVAVG